MKRTAMCVGHIARTHFDVSDFVGTTREGDGLPQHPIFLLWCRQSSKPTFPRPSPETHWPPYESVTVRIGHGLCPGCSFRFIDFLLKLTPAIFGLCQVGGECGN